MDFPDAVGPDIIAVHGVVNGKEVIVIACFLTATLFYKWCDYYPCSLQE